MTGLYMGTGFKYGLDENNQQSTAQYVNIQ
jgi:hypothetical protein